MTSEQPLNHLINYTLHLADNALILSHRNSEWTVHGPILEQDIAISNIALDLIGQSRFFYQYAAKIINDTRAKAKWKDNDIPATEDSLAYLRDAWDFRNCLLVEQLNGDWAKTILRQFFFSTYQFYLYEQLLRSSDATLSAISEKSLKEVTYHLRWSSEWVIRLGDGTEESNCRMQRALSEIWKYTAELTIPADYESALAKSNIAVDVALLKDDWNKKTLNVLEEATLLKSIPDQKAFSQTGGKEGKHTEHLGYILAEMQFMQRTYPGNDW